MGQLLGSSQTMMVMYSSQSVEETTSSAEIEWFSDVLLNSKYPGSRSIRETA